MRKREFQAERGFLMYSNKFKTFIQIWQKDFAIERTIDERVCLDKDGHPLLWYTYPAIEYLRQFDYKEKKIFEFGCGMSSLFWAMRAKKVVSVEDNPEWFAKWQKEFNMPNLEVRCRSSDNLYERAVFEDEDRYDVIVVDGKRRAACCEAAVRKLADGGMIILDDSDRVNTSAEYAAAIAALQRNNLLQVDFYGFCPMNNYTKTTSLFLRRDFDFKTSGVQPANGWGNLWSMSRKKRKMFYRENVLVNDAPVARDQNHNQEQEEDHCETGTH